MGPLRRELVNVLLNHGASRNYRTGFGGSLLISLCSNEDADPHLLQDLLKNETSDILNYKLRATTFKWRSIHRVARFLHRRKLTNSGLINALAQDAGSTALHYAVQRGDVDVVEILLKHGADPSIENNLGKMPVDYCDAFPELRGGLKRVIHQRQKKESVNLYRRDSTASDLKFPMYLIPLAQLQNMYGGEEPRIHRIETHEKLKEREELVRWEDLPFDAYIIFFSHEWVGWNHPDPHGIQVKTFLKVMKRLASGEIDKVDMGVYHAMIYKTNYTVYAEEWKEILSTAYIWIDWSSMPQPNAFSLNVSAEEKNKITINQRNAIKSIPAYVEKADFVVIVAPGCLHADRRDPNTNLRTKTCYRTYVT